MPAHARVNGGDVQASNSHAAGRARQRLKLAGIGYAQSRHGIDADLELVHRASMVLRQMAIEFVAALPGTALKNRRIDLLVQADAKMLEIAAIAYSSARHGIDADVGMAREGMALLCQAAIDFVEALPKEEPKRSADPHLQIGNGA